MTLSEFIQRAVDIANQGQPALVTRVSAEVAVEPLVATVFQRVTRVMAADKQRRALVVDHAVIALVNGTGTLPANALVEDMARAVVSDPADPTMARKMRYVRSWFEFIRPLDLTLGYFTVLGTNDFHMTQPGTAYSPGTGMTGNITLTAALVPPVPVAPGNSIVAPGEFVDDALMFTAAALRGEWQKVVAQEAAVK